MAAVLAGGAGPGARCATMFTPSGTVAGLGRVDITDGSPRRDATRRNAHAEYSHATRRRSRDSPAGPEWALGPLASRSPGLGTQGAEQLS